MISISYINLGAAIVSLIFLSCQRGANHQKMGDSVLVPEISFDPSPREELGEPQYEMIDIELISLNVDANDKRSFLPPIDGLFINGSYIYIVSRTENSVTIFDLNGTFINRIQSVGKAPDEYINITDVNLNREDGTLDLLVNHGAKLMSFDARGNFLDYKRMVHNGFVSLRSLNDGYVFYKSLLVGDEQDVKQGKSFRLESYDRALSAESKLGFLPFTFSGRKIPKATTNLDNLLSLPSTQDTVVLFESISDTIYSVTEKSVTPRYKLSYEGEGDRKGVILSDPGVLNKSDAIRQEKLTYLLNWLENEQHVFMQYSVHPRSGGKNARHLTEALFDKQTGEVTPFMKFYRFPIKVDGVNLHFNFGFRPQFVDLRSGRFIAVVSPIDLLGDMERPSPHRDAMIALFNKHGLNDLDENSNPVLLFFNMRSIQEKTNP